MFFNSRNNEDKKIKDNETGINNKNIHTNWERSKIDILYLNKIYKICELHKVKIILISTPVIEKRPNGIFHNEHINYWKTNLKNASYLDLSNLEIGRDNFADNSHLNKKGAEIFSLILRDRFKNK